MKRFIQLAILNVYRLVRSSGLHSTTWGRDLSERAYFIYKKLFELNIDHLRDAVRPGTTVLDVGANIGFFTVMFSKWTIDGVRLIAIEPESSNVDALKRSIVRNKCQNVEIIHAAAAESEGNLFLSLNLTNPADHRLGEDGVPITAVTIDGLMRSKGWPIVSFIKMDIQGAEPRALAGASETISRFHPTIFMEVDDEALQAAGFSANELIDSLRCLGYRMYSSAKAGIGLPLDNDDAQKQREKLGYADFVFIHKKYDS